MIDIKKIRGDIIKLLDNLYAEGYIVGKLEIDFDMSLKSFKIDIHEFSKEGDYQVRKTTTIR